MPSWLPSSIFPCSVSGRRLMTFLPINLTLQKQNSTKTMGKDSRMAQTLPFCFQISKKALRLLTALHLLEASRSSVRRSTSAYTSCRHYETVLPMLVTPSTCPTYLRRVMRRAINSNFTLKIKKKFHLRHLPSCRLRIPRIIGRSRACPRKKHRSNS